MEQKVKVGDYVILTDPLNYGKRVKVKEVNDDGAIVYDGGITYFYMEEPKGIDAIAHPDYGTKQAEMLKDLMSQMDVKGQDDHRAKIAEREYWRKLRGDILLALLDKSMTIDMSLPDMASDFTERLYRQDKDFFRNLDKDKDFEE